MMLSTNTIFTIQTVQEHKSNLVQIETLITGGLYRFTLLGMLTRHASATRDRVYSALRSSNLLNLKSDNRKIIVNITPDDTDKKEGIYDLGIALSILSCVHKKNSETKVLVLGGLSISGKIIASNRLKQGIYTAYSNKIQYIICSQEDVEHISNQHRKELETFNIYIIAVHTLQEAFTALLHIEKKPEQETVAINKLTESFGGGFSFSEFNPLSKALCIGLCGGHHTIIQTTSTYTAKEHLEVLYGACRPNQVGYSIYTAYKEKLLDNENLPNDRYIDNIKKLTRADLIHKQLHYKDSLVALYTPCSCGYQFSFFEPTKSERKCICSQRNILQHRRYIESSFFDIFNIHIKNIDVEFLIHPEIEVFVYKIRKYQFERYCQENKLTLKDIYFFPDNSYLNQHRNTLHIEKTLHDEAREIWQQSKKEVQVLKVAQTIQDIMDLTSNNTIKKPTISRQALILALSYNPKMDF